MKRKITFALVTVSALGGAWSCFSMAQDPVAPAQAPGAQVPSPPRGFGFATNGTNYVRGMPGNPSPGGMGMAGPVGSGPISINEGESVLAKKVSSLAKQLKSAEGADKDSVAQKLKAAVSEQFDFRHNAKASELEVLEQQLAKLQEIHNKRTLQRDRIITDRVQQILLEVESLGWGVSEGSESQTFYTNNPGGFNPNAVLAPASRP